MCKVPNGILHWKLDEDTYEEGDQDKMQLKWFGQRMSMDQVIYNPICCNTLWALNYFLGAIGDPELET